jgi:hypothetical protein
MFGKTLEQHLRNVIRQGNSTGYEDLFRLIVHIHRETFTEENLPTAEDAILEHVNYALDVMWKKEHVPRDMAVYKTFIAKREAPPAPTKTPDPCLNFCLATGSGPTCVPLSRHGCMWCPEFPERKEAFQKREHDFEVFVKKNKA